MSNHEIKFVYFGGEPIGVPVLNALKAAGYIPQLIVCNPDRPVGRKHVLTAPPVKVWATENNIPVLQPEVITKADPVTVGIGSLHNHDHPDPDNVGIRSLHSLISEQWDVFVVVAYNKILPKWFIELPKYGTINVHPSLLPKLRGASPIRSTILNDMRQECGVSVMVLDEKMDHGPIIAQQNMVITEEAWPMPGPMLDEALGRLGGAVLAEVMPRYVAGEIIAVPQDHAAATYCGKIEKEMAELKLDPYQLPTGKEAYQAYLKIQAYAGWPVAFFIHNGKRYKITAAHIDSDEKLVIDTVVPEGKTETDFSAIFS